MKKLICLLTALLLVISLIGCGKQEAPAASSGEAEPAAKADTAEEAEAAKTEQEAAANNLVVLDSWDDETRTAAFTFDDTQLEVWDEGYNTSDVIELVKIGDPTSRLRIHCEAKSLEEVQEELVHNYINDIWYELGEFTESTFADCPAWTCEITEDGALFRSIFLLEVPNGLYLTVQPYDGTVPLEEMLSYAFVTVEAGDGTVQKPAEAFQAEADASEMNVYFDSGETFTLTVDPAVAEISLDNRNTVYFDFLDEEMNELVWMECWISDQYASLEEYLQGELAQNRFYDGEVTLHQASLNGMDVHYISGDYYGGGYFFIPLNDTYALRGLCSFTGEPEDAENYTVIKVLERLLGAQAEGDTTSQTTAQTGSANSSDYTTPSGLEDSIESMTYAIDGVVYRFPTPVTEFLDNGWHIPEDYIRNDGIEIPANGYRDVALITEGASSMIYNVVVANPTDKNIHITDGIVVWMIVAQNSNVDIQFPMGMSLNTTIDELDALCDVSPAQNGNYSTFSWWNEETDATLMAWYHPEIGLEYFEFAGM